MIIFGSAGLFGSYVTSGNRIDWGQSVGSGERRQLLSYISDQIDLQLDVSNTYGRGRALQLLGQDFSELKRPLKLHVRAGHCYTTDGEKHIWGVNEWVEFLESLCTFEGEVCSLGVNLMGSSHQEAQQQVRSMLTAVDSVGIHFGPLGVVLELHQEFFDALSTHLTFIQCELNALNWNSVGSTAKQLRALGYEIWAMKPLADAFLARDFSISEVGPNDYRRSISPELISFQKERANRFFEDLPTQIGQFSRAALAIAFVIAAKDVSKLVVGPKSIDQVKDVLAAIELARLPEVTLAFDSMRFNIGLKNG